MSITSDITLDASRFNPDNITEQTKQANTFLEKATTNGPRWYEIGAEKYRQMRETGETPLPIPVYLPDSQARASFCIFTAAASSWAPTSNETLKRYATTHHLTAISVGYRLAPEHPWPAAIHDCFDAATHLVDHGPSLYPNAPLLFLSGESAGGCLAAVTAFHLLRERPTHRLAGLVIPFGQFDLTLNLPSVVRFERELVVGRESLRQFAEAYTPGMGVEERRDAKISPLYEDLNGLVAGSKGKGNGGLPPALFLCGTEDPLLDDTLLMGAKWMGAGGEAVVRIWPGAAHGFTIVPGFKPAEEAIAVASGFVGEKLEAALGW